MRTGIEKCKKKKGEENVDSLTDASVHILHLLCSKSHKQ